MALTFSFSLLLLPSLFTTLFDVLIHEVIMSSRPLLQLCLVCRGDRKIVELNGNDSLRDLYACAQANFSSSSSLRLLHGIPPRPLDQSSTLTLHQAQVQHLDRIQVVLNDDNSTVKNDNTSEPSRPQRAAAKAASESFGDAIRAQESMMQQQRTNARTTSNKKTSKRKRNTAAPKPTTTTAGRRRMADGATSARTAGGTRKKPTSNIRTTDDVSMALLDALNGGGSKVSQVLRGAMKHAISQTYQASRAVSKVAAVQAGNYTIHKQQDDGQLQVTYSKGLEGRGQFEETVDNISLEALQAVVTAIYNNVEQRELLKETTLAQVSPRVFWSLFYLYKEARTVEEALQSLLPDLDWSFFQKRRKTLSEKAKENLRQEQKDESGADENDVEAAHDAVQAVEEAMDQLSSYDTSQRRERAARAAMARENAARTSSSVDNDDTGTTSAWHLVTPAEQDDEELQECVSTNIDAEPEVKRIISVLHAMDIYNWRQLAIANEEAVSQAVHLPQDRVETWIDYAQAQSVEEMMVQVCDNRAQVVEVLRDEARTGTIKDLCNWRHMPDLLYSSAPSLGGMGVEISHIRTWCQRAQDVLEEYEWVQWYATPVE